MKIRELLTTDSFVIETDVSYENEDVFVKGFERDSFYYLGLDFAIKETYYSVSKKGTLRGMHFQIPPHGITKLITCIEGEIYDAVIDLRKESQSYHKSFTTILSSENRKILVVPEGFAHGFYALSEKAVLLYLCSGVYNPLSDTGIRWDSCGIDWPNENPIMSERDKSLMPLKTFISPF